MSHEFRLQDPGEGIHEAEILEVLVAKGDRVKEGDDVLVAETDKAAVEIPSPVSGEVREVKVAQGDVVRVGDVLMVIEEDSARTEAEGAGKRRHEASPSPSAAREKQGDTTAAVEPDEHGVEQGEPDQKTEHRAKDEGAERRSASDRAARDARAAADRATGRQGDERRRTGVGRPKRDSTGDRQEAAKERDEADQGTRRAPDRGDGHALATPAVRGLARDLGVDLEAISGSGPEGRILEDDVEAAAPEHVRAQQAGEAGADAKPEAPTDVAERIKLRSVRRTTARRMSQAWREIPHVVHHDQIDITALERLRAAQAAAVEAEGGKLTLTPFLVKALADALSEHPRFNATFDAEREEIVVRQKIHIGVALDTERGLMVPVLRDADRKSVIELAVELAEVAKLLREHDRASSDLLKGGTFTLTNVGAIGGSGFSPIINPPQVAIFGAARARLHQIVKGDLSDYRTDVALILPVCVAFDHRAADGADAARFMNSVKRLLSDPAEFVIRA